MDVHENNPAGRLLRLMEPALQDGKRFQSLSSFNAWAHLLRVPAADRGGVFRRLGMALELPAVIDREMRSIPDYEPSRYISWIPGVSKVFHNNNFAENFASCLAAFDSNVQNLIWICSDQLSRLRAQPTVDAAILEELHKSAEDLLSSLSDSGLPEQLREFIVRQMEIVERAIGDYRLQGISAIYTGVEAAAGMMVCREDVFEEVKATPKGAQMWKILQRLAHVSSITNSGIKLLEFFQVQSLPGG